MTPHDKSKDSHRSGRRSSDLRPEGVGPDEFSVFMPGRAKRPGLATRHILLVGVAGACVLGVTLGLWARPAMTERRAAAPAPADVAASPPVEHRLQIVVGDRPAPAAQPLEVLAAKSEPAALSPTPRPLPWPEAAPVAPPQGLLKVRTVAQPEAPVAPVSNSAPPSVEKPKLARMALAAMFAPKPAPQQVAVSKAAAPKAWPPAPVHLAKVAPDPKILAKAHRLELAKAAAATAAAHKLEFANAAKAIKAVRQRQAELAQAEARGRAQARAEAKTLALAEARNDARKRARLMALAHAVQKLMPHAARPAPVQVAKAERKSTRKARHEPRIEQASLKTRRPAPHVAAPPAYRTRAPQPPPQRASGLMKVSDPGLGAAERQLTRAYQDARAAGVPDAQLQRQQQRWLAARSAAAREAPWVVHDVYLARIAELNGQAREARPAGY